MIIAFDYLHSPTAKYNFVIILNNSDKQKTLPGNGPMRFGSSVKAASATNTCGLVTSVPDRVAGRGSSRVPLISLDPYVLSLKTPQSLSGPLAPTSTIRGILGALMVTCFPSIAPRHSGQFQTLQKPPLDLL